ncbi:MAG: hypothetical protein CME30_04085 [Gemmatimonadetes bacterium]|nr:hypothetical protein [Gemmatimonadota bacterium]
MNSEVGIDYFPIEVGAILNKLNRIPNPHLVTRTTGRDVRGAIEENLSQAKGPVLLHVDFSTIGVMDFSCADEVVAKLLVRFIDPDRPQDAFFVLRGLLPSHLEPVAEVLDRQRILAVTESIAGSMDLLGNVSSEEARIWEFIENKSMVTHEEMTNVLIQKDDQIAFRRLLHQRVIFQGVEENCYCSLGSIIRDLM